MSTVIFHYHYSSASSAAIFTFRASFQQPTSCCSNTSMANTLRRGSRARRAPSRGLSSLSASPQKASRVARGERPTRRFLSDLYQELAIVATHGPLDRETMERRDRENAERQDLLRFTRLNRFLQRLDPATQAQCTQAIQNYAGPPNLGDNFHLVQTDITRLQGPRRRRLQAFIDRLGYPLLSICARSRIFREALTSNSFSDNPNWDQKLRGISDNAVSLEFFARVHGLDWREYLDEVGHIFQPVVRHVLKPLRTPNTQLPIDLIAAVDGYTLGVEGVRSEDRIQGSRIAFDPHTCAVPRPYRNAQPRQITFTVSADLEQEPANQQLAINDPQRLHVGQVITKPQEKIDESIVLRGNYQWPSSTAWPENHPSYAGFEPGDQCRACGEEQPLLPSRAAARRIVQYQRCCNHTYETYRESEGHSPIRIELINTPNTGTGVRSLQTIQEGDVLGIYFGEIYPYKRGSNRQNTLNRLPRNRYEGSEAGSYILPLEVSRRQARPRARDGAADLAPREVRQYAVDSAVKGNWTRYINHSCDSNTEFEIVNIGSRRMMAMVAMRNIEFGEPITVNYGDSYFGAMNIECKCYTSGCTYWRVNNPGGQTLDEAFAQNVAPAWAQHLRRTVGLPTHTPGTRQRRRRNTTCTNAAPVKAANAANPAKGGTTGTAKAPATSGTKIPFTSGAKAPAKTNSVGPRKAPVKANAGNSVKTAAQKGKGTKAGKGR